MRTAAAALALLAAAAPAAADPAPPPRELSPYLAFGLSLGTTAAGYGAIYAGSDDNIPLTGTGVALITLGPTAGHWYQGRLFTPALGARIGGLLAVGYVFGRAEDRCGDHDCSDDGPLTALAVAGMFAFIGGTAHDIVMAPKRAHATNQRNHVTLAPQVGGDRAGLVLAGTF